MKLSSKIIGLTLILFANLLYANWALAGSAAGLWKTIDDKTGKPRSLVRISEENGTFSGVVEKGLREGDSGERVCDKCTDERKDQKILGMTIMRGLKESSANHYDGGKILDPENGKEYKCKMTLSEDGNKLEVRGFIGFSLLGRSQIWTREE